MRRLGLLVGVVFFSVQTALAQTIGARIERILSKSPAAQQALWGIRVVNLESGAVVYSKNDDQFFIPASNTKLFSTALALNRLGPDYRFRTVITSPMPLDGSGRVSELRFVGGGDPNLSGRIIPYEYDSKPEDPLRYVEQFAQQLVDSGLKFVDGDIVGDDSAYSYDPYPEGWALDDPVYDYGAPVSALSVNDGAFTLHFSPAAVGETPTIDCVPCTDHLLIHNKAVTGDKTKLRYDRLPGSFELTIAGTVSSPHKESFGVEDSPLYAAECLRDALLKRGVRISGTARADHFSAPGATLLTHESQSLIEDLRVINKDSHNLHAETVLLEVARVSRGTGSREGAIDELKEFLKEIGVADKQYHFKDGSGLSRQTLVTATTITKLLMYMYNSPHRDAWMSTLPIGGEDGTLAKRFSGARAASQVYAKTGSITHVNTLSGYVGRYAFSILVNNTNREPGPVRRVMDQIALALAR